MSRKDREQYDFSLLKMNGASVSDPIYGLIDDPKANGRGYEKDAVFSAIQNLRYENLIDISDYFYRTNGIYSRLCRYAAYMYRYDWVLTPYFPEDLEEVDDKTKAKMIKNFYTGLRYLDNFEVKKFFGEVALKVIRKGCYYGYLNDTGEQMYVQELPYNYCRSRFKTPDGRAVVEFNAKYFDDNFKTAEQRNMIFTIFPEEFKKNYKKYKKGKLPAQYPGDQPGWFMLDVNRGIKFNINDEDFPMFISVIPLLMDLIDAQELQKKKMEQQLLKIIVQKFPLDKNGDLVFDTSEMRDLHQAATQMLGKAIGVQVLTTVADVDVADTADKKNNATSDDLAKAERGVFNAAGVSQMQFNTDGNIALEKSILNDEASLQNLIQQFESFLNCMIRIKFPVKKNFYMRVQILNTTIYNYKEISKQYKEMTQLGYSKMLPQIALGQSQSSVLATAKFENQILDLVNLFVPPLSSNTLNADSIRTITGKDDDKNATTAKEKSDPNNEGGRPTNEEKGEPLSEKRMKNIESEG